MTTELKSFIYRSWIFFGILTALIIITVKLWPASEILLFQEDGLIESGTAIIDGIAALLGFYAIYLGVSKGRDLLDWLAIWTIPVLSAICALDEISWGARLFNLQMPEMEGGCEFDGLHDVFVILQRWVVDAEPMNLFAIALLILTLLCMLLYWQRKFIASCLEYAVHSRLGRPLASAILLLMFATMLDFGHGRIISSLEEYAEISAGIFLLVAAYISLKMAYRGQTAPLKQKARRQQVSI